MAEIRYVDRASYSPTQCALCTTHEGPFIDTGVEFIGYGHVYICTSHSGRSGCVQQMGKRDGMVTINEIEAVSRELSELQAEHESLKAEQEAARVVPMHEVLQHLAGTTLVARPEPVGRES